MRASSEQEIARVLSYRLEIIIDCQSGLLGDLELDGPPCLPLSHGCAVHGASIGGYIAHPEAYDIATAQFAIDSKIKEGQVSLALGQYATGHLLPKHVSPEAAVWDR